MTWEILGHERAVALFSRALVANQLSHAYLLTGPASIGKRTLAIELARAALCLTEAVDAAPCGACPSCVRITATAHPDLRIVELDGEHVQISRKEIGQLQADAALKPLVGQRKVYVLVDVERLSVVASSQLLKLLEEPPAGVMFVLTSSDIGAVLPTILSRCQVIRLHPPSRAAIEAYLGETLDVGPEAAHQIAELADGRIGWAIRAGADPELTQTREAALRNLGDLLEASRLNRLLAAQGLAGRWTNDRAGVLEMLDWWAAALRDLAIDASGGVPGRGLGRSGGPIADLHGRIRVNEAIDAARRTQATAQLLEQNVNARLALDALLLDLPTAPRN